MRCETILLVRYWSASSVAPFLPITRPVSGPLTSSVTRSPSSVAATCASRPIFANNSSSTDFASSTAVISVSRLRRLTIQPPLLRNREQRVRQNINREPRRQEDAEGGEHERHGVHHRLLLRVRRLRREPLLREHEHTRQGRQDVIRIG